MAAASAAVLRDSSFSPRSGAFIRPTIRFGRFSALPCRSAGVGRPVSPVPVSRLCRNSVGRRPRLCSAAPLSFAGRLFRHFQTPLSYLAASVPFRRRIDCSAENSCLWDPHFTLFSPVFGSLMQRPNPSLCRSPFVILPFAACPLAVLMSAVFPVVARPNCAPHGCDGGRCASVGYVPLQSRVRSYRSVSNPARRRMSSALRTVPRSQRSTSSRCSRPTSRQPPAPARIRSESR